MAVTPDTIQSGRPDVREREKRATMGDRKYGKGDYEMDLNLDDFGRDGIVKITRIVLDGVPVEGTFRIRVDGDKREYLEVPETLDMEGVPFRELMGMVNSAISTRSVALEMEGPVRSDTAAGTVGQALTMLTHFVDNIIPEMVKSGQCTAEEGEHKAWGVNNSMKLIRRHARNIKHVETGTSGFGTPEIEKIYAQITVLEEAEIAERAQRLNIALGESRMVQGYILDKKATEQTVQEEVDKGEMTADEAKAIMKRIRKLVAGEARGYVSNRLKEIATGIAD